MDRALWILKEEKPDWCFGLGGRSASFGEIYGDMFDHHTVVYEFAKRAARLRPVPHPGRLLRQRQRHHHGHQGHLLFGQATSTTRGRSGSSPATPHYTRTMWSRSCSSTRSAAASPINSGYYMAKSTMAAVMGQLACYAGRPLTWDEVAKSDFQFGPPPDAV